MSASYAAFQRELDIVAVAERLTDVHRNGDGGKILCPAHEEKTPSCYLYPDGGWKCFGCEEWGDIIKLTQLLRGCTFTEALDWLAETFNVARPERNPETEARERARRAVRDALVAGLEAAIEANEPLPGGLDADLARRLGLGRANGLSKTLAGAHHLPLAMDELEAWEGAWTIELHVRGGHAGFAALLAGPSATTIGAVEPNPSPALHLAPSRMLRGIAFAGLPAGRESIARTGAAIVTPDVSEMLELQAVGIRSVITPSRSLLSEGVTRALAELAPRIVIVVTRERRRERGFAAACLSLVAAGSKVELAMRTADGLATPVPLAAYVAAVARMSGVAGRRLVAAFLDAVPSPSSRALYASEFEAQGLVDRRR